MNSMNYKDRIISFAHTGNYKSGKYLTFEMLSNINESSINAGRNRNVYIDILPIDVEKRYPVKLAFPHNDEEMRTEILLNENGDSCWLDMSLEEYSDLPIFPIFDLGEDGT